MGSDGQVYPGFYGGEHNARLKSELNKMREDEELQDHRSLKRDILSRMKDVKY